MSRLRNMLVLLLTLAAGLFLEASIRIHKKEPLDGHQ
jgi:hypothetical protein